MLFLGFGLKSATLILQTYLNKPIVVCVNPHLQRTFKKFNWVHHDSSSADESAIQVSLWLDITEFININNVIAGIQQLLQSKKTKEMVRRISKECGVYHLVCKVLEELPSKKIIIQYIFSYIYIYIYI